MSLEEIVAAKKKQAGGQGGNKRGRGGGVRNKQGGRPRFGSFEGRGGNRGGRREHNQFKAKRTGNMIQKDRAERPHGGRHAEGKRPQQVSSF